MFRDVCRQAFGAYAEPDVIVIPELPKTTSGKTTRSLLRAMLHTGALTPNDAVGRSVANTGAYWACAHAIDCWRRTKMMSDVPIMSLGDWNLLAVDCHVIGNSPLIPAAGWLVILHRIFRYKQIENVQFLRAVRDRHTMLVARKFANRVDVVRSISDDSSMQNTHTHETSYVRCSFPKSNCNLPVHLSSCSFDLTAWNDANAIVDDINGEAHYRHCRSVSLDYSGPYKCVTRVIWRFDFSFRARVQLHCCNNAALLDAALQVVCSLDAVGAGIALIPFSFERVQLVDIDASHCDAIIIGALNTRASQTVTADFAFFRINRAGISRGDTEDDCELFGVLEPSKVIAILEGVAFSALEESRRRIRKRYYVRRMSVKPNETLGNSSPIKEVDAELLTSKQKQQNRILLTSGESAPGNVENQHMLEHVLSLSAGVTGGAIDPSKTLVENGLYSLRAVELIGKLNETLNVLLEPRHITGVKTFSELARLVQKSLKKSHAEKTKRVHRSEARFGHVDMKALNWIAKARLRGINARRDSSQFNEHGCATMATVHDALRAFVYMLRRGFMRYLQIQYRDGLLHFFVHPPMVVDLNVEVVVPSLRVGFHQTDYNRHFTVREIIRDSERGFYNLVHASGLAHLEHFYRVMFFASRLEAQFDLELLEGEAYEMRVAIRKISGPLLDVEVAFHRAGTGSRNKDSFRTFSVTWRLMLVVDSTNKIMYDFERGGAFSPDEALKIDDPSCSAATTMNSNCYSQFIVRFIVGFLGVSLACAPLTMKAICSTLDIAALILPSVEGMVMVSTLILWIRVSLRLDSNDGPVEALVPHG